MKGLLIKDMYMSKGMTILTYIMAAFGFVFLGLTKSPFFMVFPLYMTGMNVIQLCSSDVMNGWSKYSQMLPLSRKDMVRARYATLMIQSLICALICSGLHILAVFISGASENMTFAEYTVIPSVYLFCTVFTACPVIPAVFGSKADSNGVIKLVTVFLTMIIVMAVFFSTFMSNELDIALDVKRTARLMSMILPPVTVLALVCSYPLTVKLYERKDL